MSEIKINAFILYSAQFALSLATAEITSARKKKRKTGFPFAFSLT